MKTVPFEAIREVLDHSREGEERRFSESDDEARDHIFLSLAAVRRWLHACGEDWPSMKQLKQEADSVLQAPDWERLNDECLRGAARGGGRNYASADLLVKASSSNPGDNVTTTVTRLITLNGLIISISNCRIAEENKRSSKDPSTPGLQFGLPFSRLVSIPTLSQAIGVLLSRLPFACELLRLGDLCWGHALFEHVSTFHIVYDARYRRQVEPHVSADIVLRHA